MYVPACLASGASPGTGCPFQPLIAAGEAATAAAHNTVLAAIRLAPTNAPSPSMASTRLLSKTSIPSFSSDRRAMALKDSGNAGSKRGADCTKITHESAGSKVRNSLAIPNKFRKVE